ncbi:formin-binding protein 4-like [Liolophura sinensis]|uniref:formin-binding protein 4-like n=1 Tax=Liolophura sinensis TaxID=3198878 RepID=UPI0031592721
MGRRRDKLQGSRRRQVLQLEDDGRDSFLTQYGYNSRYGEEEEDDVNEAPMFRQLGYLYEENMDMDSDERNPDTEDDGRSGIDFKSNGGSHSEGPQEGKKIDSELANFMAEIEAISSVAPPPSDDQEEDGQEGMEKVAPEKESTPELPTKVEGKAADSNVVYLEEPVTCWQQCLDENTECYYYWHIDTNEVTWDIPPEYTQYLLQFKAFEEKVLALEQAGKTVKITGGSQAAGLAGTEKAGDSGERETQVYGPFLPKKPSEDSSKAGHGEDNKGSNSAVSVVQGSGKLLSADYYDSDDASEDDADKSEKQPTVTAEPAEAEDDDLDFDIDDIDRELELALERKQAEIKEISKTSVIEKVEETTKTTSSNADDLTAVCTVPTEDGSSESKPDDFITAPGKIIPETVTPVVVQDSADGVDKSSEDLKDAIKLSTNSPKLLTEFKADNEEKDRNFKKLIEVKDDRVSLERRERKVEERHEKKSSREEKRSSKEDKRSDRKSERKEDRKSEHKEKKKKDDRKEDKKSHRHKSSSREKSKHGSDHKRTLSDQESGDSDEYRSHRKRSKHKHKDKSKDRALTSVITVEPRPATPTDVLPPKPDTTASSVKDEDKTIKETIVEISETVFGKLQFLEIVKEGLSGLQMLLISLETRIQDWEAGGLSNQYLLKKLQDASDQLLKYEDSAAPPGWSTHWNRNYRRYFYTNVVTGDSQWDYPDLDDTETATTTTEVTKARVPQDGEAAVTNGATDKGNKERTDGSKEDTDKGIKHTSEKVESKLEELQPLVHPGEPPPPGTETPGSTELGQASMDEGSYEVSPTHSIDLEEIDDVREDVEKAPSEPKDSAVISRPPLLLGPESGDPTHANHAPASQGAHHLDEVPNPTLSQPEGPASNSVPEVAPSAEGERGVPDPNTSHHKDKEKKKKKDKSISSSSLSLKKKKVSSLVQKWQQVQQEVEREEKSSKERESYLNRYSP